MRRLAVVLAIFAAPGCIPGRDNLNDPQNRPTAVLTVLYSDVERDSLGHPLEGADEACVAEQTSFPDSGVSRGQCLVALDAGTKAEDGAGFSSTFRITWVGTSTDGEAVMNGGVMMPTEIRGHSLTWVPSPSTSGFSVAALTVHLDVVDDRGAKSHVSQNITLTNTAPVARKRGHISIPVYGAIWDLDTPLGNGNTTLDIHLDGGNSYDADDDPLRYCWSGDSVESTCSLDDPLNPLWVDTPQAFASLPFPVEPNSSDAKLRVFDGVSMSQRTGAGIALASIPSWGVDKSGNAVILDLNRQTYGIPSAGPVDDPLPGGAFIPESASGPNRLIAAFGDASQVRAWAVGSTAGGPILDFVGNRRVMAMEADPARELVWAAVAQDLGALAPTLLVYALEFEPPGSTTLVVRDEWVPAVGAPILGAKPALVTDGFGITTMGITELWIAPQFGDHAYALRFDHATNTISEIRDHVVPAGRMITAIDIRKTASDFQAFVVDAVDALAGGSDEEPVFTVITRGTAGNWSAEVAGRFDLPGVDTAGLQPWGLRFYSNQIDGEKQAWTNLFGVGLASLIIGIEDGVPELILDELAPTTRTGFELSVNELSGRALLVHGGRHGFTRALRDGAIAEVETVSRVLGVWEVPATPGVPRIGTVWTLLDREGTISPRIAIGEGSGSEGFLLRAPIFPGYEAYAIDYSSGELWVGSVVPPGLARVQIDGTVTDFVTGLDNGGVPDDADHPPPALWLANEPNGSTIWMLAASDPTYGGADLFYRFDPNALRIDDQVGLVLPGLAFPPVANAVLGFGGAEDEYAVRAFAIPDTNDLVVTTFENFTMETHIRRIDGVTGQVAGNSVDGVLGATSAAVSRDLLDGGICVASVVPGAPPQLRLARYDSLLVSEYAVVVTGGFIEVLSSAAGNEECWTGVRTMGGNQVVLWRPGSTPFGVAGPSVTVPRYLVSFLDPSLKNPGATSPYFQSQAWVSGDTQMMRLVVGTAGTPSNLVLRVDEIIDTTSEVVLVQP